VSQIRPTIEELHRGKTGKVSDKWQSYLPYYEALFSPLRECPVSLLEIGIQNGGSLETWAAAFAAGERFVGCDIDPRCGTLKYDDPRIRVVVGDANALPTFQAIHDVCPSYDIVIDDGSHRSTDILKSFVNYFPLVKPGGLYVVEDTHTLYLDSFGGGVLNEFGAYAFFKRLVDVLNHQFWRDQLALNTYLRTFFPLGATPAFIVDGWIEQIEFRNSMITLRKSLLPTHDRLGERLVVGTRAPVRAFEGNQPVMAA
jgi:hypothetical protein